jgi:NAD-dependent oxidoreductase involved in siderophore biosynthesis
MAGRARWNLVSVLSPLHVGLPVSMLVSGFVKTNEGWGQGVVLLAEGGPVLWSSWMNLVERFLRDLTVDCARDGSFSSVAELTRAIEACLAEQDLNLVRYEWKAEGAAILEKIQRARTALAKEKAGNNE